MGTRGRIFSPAGTKPSGSDSLKNDDGRGESIRRGAADAGPRPIFAGWGQTPCAVSRSLTPTGPTGQPADARAPFSPRRYISPMMRNDKELIVVGDRVLVKVEEGEERTKVGLYLPSTALDSQAVQ